MERRRVRLGDVIDDYCTRCRLIMNHGIVGMVGEDVRKVRCNTCMTEHLYKHGKVPAKKRRENARLFEEVLRGLGRTPDGPEEAHDEAPPEDETAAPPATGSRGAPDGIAAAEADDTAPEPDAPAPPERSAEEVHGVRRKLYTIRRHSGGKAPVGGDSSGGATGR